MFWCDCGDAYSRLYAWRQGNPVQLLFLLELEQEYHRLTQLGGCWGARRKGSQERYNEHWEERLLEAVNAKFRCIADTMLHEVNESIPIYAGTDD